MSIISYLKYINKRVFSLSIVAIVLHFVNPANAQGPSPTGSSCVDAIPFCTGTNYSFPNISNGSTSTPGANYGCLGSQPNPVWYYMKIANPGTMQISISQFSLAGNTLDVDFAMWGPFTDLAAGCAAIFGGNPAAPLQCSYSSSNTETIGIGLPGGVGSGATTPPNAITGQYYIVLFTNYGQSAGTLSFSQTAGTATTDCSIISCGVTVTSNSPICQNDTAHITLVNTNDTDYVYNYIWSGPNGFTSTDKEPSIANIPPGLHTYEVKAIATLPNGGFDTCTETVEILVHPTYVHSEYESICAGDSLLWHDLFLTTAGQYDTVLKSINGCDSLIKLTLTVVPKPTKIEMLDSIVACQYDSVALESNTLPYSNSYIYNWTPNTNLNVDNQPNVWFFADQSRRYVLTVSNNEAGISCSLRDTIDVIVNPGDFLQVPVKDTSICPNESIQLHVSGASSYKWLPNIYMNDNTSANPIFNVQTSTVYTLVGTSDKGCTDTQIVSIKVYPQAVIEIPNDVTIYPGEQYYMQPHTNAVFFNWFPNSGLSANNISNPIMQPDVDTRYFVTAKTEFGCEVSDSVNFWVKETVIDMPNAFNPNTTTFKADLRGKATLESFEIYNRWGGKVFETKDMNIGWDGKLNNNAQPFGVYVYVIHAKTLEGKPFKKTGNVTLVR